MSTFEEAIKAYLKGKKIRRLQWCIGFYSYDLERDNKVDKLITFNKEDREATDWVIGND